MPSKISKRVVGRPSSQIVLSSVIRCDSPGQVSVPNHLSLGNDGKLYLTRTGDTESPKLKPQSITLKESFAWFRVANECAWNLRQGDSFNAWLRMIENTLP